jgi:hypothetical protein
MKYFKLKEKLLNDHFFHGKCKVSSIVTMLFYSQ